VPGTETLSGLLHPEKLHPPIPLHWLTLKYRRVPKFTSLNQQQAGRSRVRFPRRSLFFFLFNLSNSSSHTLTLRSTQPLTEMSIRNLPGSNGRPARKVDNLTAICEPIVYKMREPRRLKSLWTLMAYCRGSLTCTFTQSSAAAGQLCTLYPKRRFWQHRYW
jgi:hypothetical protein